MKRRAVLEVIEAAYRSAPDRDEWATAVTNAISSLEALPTVPPDPAFQQMWRGMVDGRWSLVDELESDGKRPSSREKIRAIWSPRAR